MVCPSSKVLCLYLSSAKTGSTWLYEVLRTSTSVSFGGSKDLFFFDRYFDRGVDWYLDRFDGRRPVWCDLSHDYVMSDGAAKRVAALGINVRFVAIVRRPGERAYSAYRYMQSQARLPLDMSFEEAVSSVDELVDHGRYARHLEPWVKEFGVDSILVADFARLRGEQAQVASAVSTHLGGINLAGASELGVVNAGRTARSQVAVRSFRVGAWILRSLGAHSVVQAIKADERAMKVLFRNGAPAPDEVDQALMLAIDEELKPDQQSLQQTFGVSW